jgi:hypothetical protein
MSKGAGNPLQERLKRVFPLILKVLREGALSNLTLSAIIPSILGHPNLPADDLVSSFQPMRIRNSTFGSLCGASVR